VPIARLAIEAKIHRVAREMQPPRATSERLSFVKLPIDANNCAIRIV
jgi:hypothetical protein